MQNRFDANRIPNQQMLLNNDDYGEILEELSLKLNSMLEKFVPPLIMNNHRNFSGGGSGDKKLNPIFT